MKLTFLTTTGSIALLATGMLPSCSSLPDAATNAALGGAGAYLGHELSDGEPIGSLLGAVAGVTSGALLNHHRAEAKEEAHASGYALGRSDEVKRLYWVRKNLHRLAEGDGLAESPIPSYYEMPVPRHVASDGTVIEPHTKVIEVLEP